MSRVVVGTSSLQCRASRRLHLWSECITGLKNTSSEGCWALSRRGFIPTYYPNNERMWQRMMG